MIMDTIQNISRTGGYILLAETFSINVSIIDINCKLQNCCLPPASHIFLLPLFMLLSNNDYGEEHHTSHVSEHEIIKFFRVI
jgi:hypothetical protein